MELLYQLLQHFFKFFILHIKNLDAFGLSALQNFGIILYFHHQYTRMSFLLCPHGKFKLSVSYKFSFLNLCYSGGFKMVCHCSFNVVMKSDGRASFPCLSASFFAVCWLYLSKDKPRILLPYRNLSTGWFFSVQRLQHVCCETRSLGLPSPRYLAGLMTESWKPEHLFAEPLS